ncbi:hypothetical protein AX16_004095 [Volvariella volvacea WC 439]|nr:hypothetical protein AX16_004095 [Volvariella volvacea WC 439]
MVEIPERSPSCTHAFCQLPSDIVLNIVFTYKHQVEEDSRLGKDESEYLTSGTYQWITITHICRAWRTLTLICPTLWTAIYIPPAQPDLVDELLLRSQPLPLSTLSFTVPYGKNINAYYISRFLCNEGARRPIQRLQLSIKGGNEPDVASLPEFLPLVLGNLEELSLICDRGTSQEVSDRFSQFIGSHAASFQLKSLCFECCHLDRGLLHDTLQRLRLDYATFGMQWDDFILSLVPMRNLRELELIQTLSHLGPPVASQPISISFSQIQRIVLVDGSIEHCISLLQSISFPPTTRIAVRTCGSRTEQMAELLATTSQSLSRAPSTNFRLLRMDVADTTTIGANVIYSNITLDAFTTIEEEAQYYFCGGFRDTSDGAIDRLRQAYTEFVKALPLKDLHHLELVGTFDSFAPFVLEFAPSLSLTTLLIGELLSDPSVLRTLNSLLPICDCPGNHSYLKDLLCEPYKEFSATYFPKLTNFMYSHRAI